MSKALVIGVSVKDNNDLGNYIAKSLREDFYEVRTISRNDELVLEPAKLMVVNIFSHAPGRSGLQEQVFRDAFELVKDTDCLLVVIGSTAHHFKNDSYAQAKKGLQDTFYELGKMTHYSCRLLLLETGFMEYFMRVPKAEPHVKFKQVVDTIRWSDEMRLRFMHIVLRA